MESPHNQLSHTEVMETPHASGNSELVEVLGVYNADGGLRGEVSYIVGNILGRSHCGLCDITHSPIRRKQEWDALVARARVRIRIVHRNETSPAETEALRSISLPCVLGLDSAGRYAVLLDADQLNALDGSVEAFANALPRLIWAD